MERVGAAATRRAARQPAAEAHDCAADAGLLDAVRRREGGGRGGQGGNEAGQQWRPESDPPPPSTRRRDVEAQVYPSRDSETQTGVQAGTAAPISRSFVAGLRGSPDLQVRVVNLTLS